MTQSYLSVSGSSHAEITEKRSQFIGDLTHLESKEEADRFIKTIRAKHKGARHCVYAYRLFSGAEHCSDDGEPQGTAGVPILEILRREELFGVCLTVTRYFGGVLLGAGGLLRAYSSCAKETVKLAKKVKFSLCKQLIVTLPYPTYNRALHFLEGKGYGALHPKFEDKVTFEVYLPLAEVNLCKKALTEISSGDCNIIDGIETYAQSQI